AWTPDMPEGQATTTQTAISPVNAYLAIRSTAKASSRVNPCVASQGSISPVGFCRLPGRCGAMICVLNAACQSETGEYRLAEALYHGVVSSIQQPGESHETQHGPDTHHPRRQPAATR